MQQFTQSWNDATNFAGLLWQAADSFPDRPAIIERDQPTVRFEDIRRRAVLTGAALLGAGVKPGDRVAILLKRGEEAAGSFFGVLAIGAVAINVNEMYRPRQIEYVLEHSEAKVLLTSADVLAAHPRPIDGSARVLLVEDFDRPLPIAPAPCLPDQLAQICYTSGSTGKPKGVMVSHANLWAGVRTVVGYLGLTIEDRIASLLPFSFVYGFNQLACSLATGAALVIERSALALDVVSALRVQEVTVLAAVPPLWLQLLKTPGFGDAVLPSLRIATNAGGRIPPEAVLRLRGAQPQARFFSMYGLTEVFRSTFLPPELADAHPDSMGRAVPGAEVFVVREDGSLCDDDEPGELVHRGPTVALGYLGDPESTARVFRPNTFTPHTATSERVVHSGDLVRRDASGLLYYVGRKDRMIKTLGYRVSPDEIADVLHQSGQIEEVIVTTEPDEQRGERIVAYVVLRASGSLAQLRMYAGTELPRYMQPTRYELREALPRNANGKYDLFALRAPAAAVAAE